MSPLVRFTDLLLDKIFDPEEWVGRFVWFVMSAACLVTSWLALKDWWNAAVATIVYGGSVVLLSFVIIVAARQELRSRNPFRMVLLSSDDELFSQYMRPGFRRRVTIPNSSTVAGLGLLDVIELDRDLW